MFIKGVTRFVLKKAVPCPVVVPRIFTVVPKPAVPRVERFLPIVALLRIFRLPPALSEDMVEISFPVNIWPKLENNPKWSVELLTNKLVLEGAMTFSVLIVSWFVQIVLAARFRLKLAFHRTFILENTDMPPWT